MNLLKGRGFVQKQLLVFCAAMLLLLPLRTYQLLRLVEPDTGFFRQTDFTVWLLYAVLLVLAAGFFAVNLLHKKQLYYTTAATKQPLLAICCLLAGLGLLWDIGMCVVHIRENFQFLTPSSDLFRSLIKTGVLPKALEALTGFGSAAFFVLMGRGCKDGTSNGGEYKLLALLPLGWASCRMIYRFTRTISFLNVSDLFFELLMLVFLLLFLMAFSQLNSRVNCKGMDWKISAYGFFAAAMCLVCFVPRAALVVVGKGSLLATTHPVEPCDLGFALFIFGLIFSRLRHGNAQTQTVQTVATSAENTQPSTENM